MKVRENGICNSDGSCLQATEAVVSDADAVVVLMFAGAPLAAGRSGNCVPAAAAAAATAAAAWISGAGDELRCRDSLKRFGDGSWSAFEPPWWWWWWWCSWWWLWWCGDEAFVADADDDEDDDIKRFRVPPLNMALTSSQACVISSGGPPLSFIWRRHELKFAASGWMYLSPGPTRCEWKINLFGEKNRPQYEHFMHLARDELYRDGRNEPRQPQAHSWCTLNAKSSGNRGGALSPRNDLHSRSASRRVIIPQRRELTGIAPARRRISNWTGVHWTHVMPNATRRLWISL